jgi:hypothetical protein
MAVLYEWQMVLLDKTCEQPPDLVLSSTFVFPEMKTLVRGRLFQDVIMSERN